MVKCNKCGKEGYIWKIDSYDGSPPDKFELCDDHAQQKGFCVGCGHFLAGVEYYEFSKGYRYGYCQPCWDDLNAELESDWDGTDDYCPY